MLLAQGIPHPHAAPLDDDARRLSLERLVRNQMVPDMGAVGFDDRRQVIGIDRRVHDIPPSVRPETANCGILEI